MKIKLRYFLLCCCFFVSSKFVLASSGSISEQKNNYSCEGKINLKEFVLSPAKITLIKIMEEHEHKLGLFELTNTSTQDLELHYSIDRSGLPRSPFYFMISRLDLERQGRGWQIAYSLAFWESQVLNLHTETKYVRPNESLDFLAPIVPMKEIINEDGFGVPIVPTKLISNEVDNYAFRLMTIDLYGSYIPFYNLIMSEPYCLGNEDDHKRE